jgi:hypothetical protein
MQTCRVVLQSKAQPETPQGVNGARIASQRWAPSFLKVGDSHPHYSFPIIVVVSNTYLILVEHHNEISPSLSLSPILQTSREWLLSTGLPHS